MLGNIRAAIQFATIFPVSRDTFQPQRVAANLPAAGLFVGMLLAVFDRIALGLWPFPVVAVLDVVALAVVTGALHLDGLGDTADGLYGGNTKDRVLEIMKDSRTGAMGVVAIVCCLLVKAAALSDIDGGRFWMLVLIPAYARAGTLFGFRMLPYGRQNEGTALAFFEKPLALSDFRWLFLLVALTVFTGWRMIPIIMGFAGLTAVTIWFYKRKLGCITGDMLGAMIEITETGLFLIAAALV